MLEPEGHHPRHMIIELVRRREGLGVHPNGKREVPCPAISISAMARRSAWIPASMRQCFFLVTASRDRFSLSDSTAGPPLYETGTF